MKIALVTQYFWPESFSINDLAKTLVEQGHTVEVFTGKPNYPEGKIFPGYDADDCAQENYGPDIKINRIPLRPRGSGGAKNLLLNYLSFVFNGLRYFPNQIKGKDFDVIFVFTLSPITSVIPAIYLKWRLKKHLAIWVLDLWPESLRATGFIQNKYILAAVGWLVRAIYSATDTILVQSQAFVPSVSRYADASKVIYYSNSYKDAPLSVGPTKIPPDIIDMLESHFCLVFAGNLGTAQAVETLMSAADSLRHLPDFRLILVGSGSMSGWLQQQKQERGLDNVILAGRYPAEEMPQFFSRAQALLVSLKRAEIFAHTVPAKVQSYLAAGRPIIASLDGEGARVVQDSGAGLVCAAEDVSGLIRCIENLYNMPASDREAMGQAGRNYFLENFEMGKQASRLVDILQRRIDGAH
ncbi:glycosyltransferase family 4 protein [Pollutimonas sp. H1-120]|uniref:glycosyltransferase family 4 protein n=1 Tax=Pollutimonas sp. H1-120 TaxID=3148824 RepID=UPI003B525F08